jgi:DNA-binding CsgD family transcriptional regulator
MVRAAVRSAPETTAEPSPQGNRVLRAYVERYALSARETAVLVLTVEGLSDKEIADRLSCSRSSISTYWCRIFAKTGSRPQRAVLSHIARTAGDHDYSEPVRKGERDER